MSGRINALIVKEMLLLWKDRRMRFIILLPPLIQVLIFTFAAAEAFGILAVFAFGLPFRGSLPWFGISSGR